jgi:uncharacterized protein
MLRFMAALWLALTLWAAPTFAQPAFPDRGTAPVLDQANIIDDVIEAQLTQQLDDFEQRNQRQFVIVTLSSLDGYDIADYGYQLGRAWALGDAERNDGIILIVAPNEKRMRIEVGYGLEGVMPDGLAFEIVEDMKPLFREGRFSEGIAQAARQIITQLELPPEEAARVAAEAEQAREDKNGVPIGMIIWFGFVLLFIIVPKLTGHGGRRRYSRSGDVADAVGNIILWEAGKAVSRGVFGGGGGGWDGGGGGFGGGGGSFGGGGASGGW